MKGLYDKYVVKKKSGKTDPKAKYIVLRIDAGEYVHACRAGVMAFARAVEPLNPVLAEDLKELLAEYPMGQALVPEGWTTPAKKCPICSENMVPSAFDAGDGWMLFFDCPNRCVCSDDEIIEWPFVVDWATMDDLEAIVFTIV